MTILCGPGTCPNDLRFQHDNYFGCVPADFNERTGRSNSYWQTPGRGWNGGCDVLKAEAS
jgi:hypothetical protein